MDVEGNLYVAGPTLAMRDPVYKINRAGKVEALLSGFARPQGLAFSPEGDLWIAAAYGGRKGILQYSFRSHELEPHIAGPMLVGLAVDDHDCFLVDSHSIYRVQLGSPSRKLS